MASPINQQELRQLEQELTNAEKRGDHLEALDILDDINKRGWASGRHLLVMGHCYLKVRQRQDAKRVWLRAFSMEPNLDAVQQALDKHFPGWENQTDSSSGSSGGHEEPPPPPSFAPMQTAPLSIEMVTPVRPEPPPPRPRPARPQQAPVRPAARAPEQTSSPVAPPQAAPVAPEPEPLPDLDAAFDTIARGEPVRTHHAAPGTLPNFDISPQGLAGSNGKVNWRGLLEEAAEIAAAK